MERRSIEGGGMEINKWREGAEEVERRRLINIEK